MNILEVGMKQLLAMKTALTTNTNVKKVICSVIPNFCSIGRKLFLTEPLLNYQQPFPLKTTGKMSNYSLNLYVLGEDLLQFNLA
jgi:hypothetical protein